MGNDLGAFALDLARWPGLRERVEIGRLECGSEASTLSFDLTELKALSLSCSIDAEAISREAREFELEINRLWPRNPLFSNSSLLEPLCGYAGEPILTRALAWMLSPDSNHHSGSSLRIESLRAFLRQILPATVQRSSIESADLTSWTATAERSLATRGLGGRHRRIDVLLKGRIGQEEFVVGIEAKLRTRESPEQVGTYLASLAGEFGGCQCVLVFLTPSGQGSSCDESLSVSYQQLVEWMLPAFRAFQDDYAASFAYLLLSDFARGMSAGLRVGNSQRTVGSRLKRIEVARKFLAEQGGLA